MGIYLGETKIGKIYVGDTKIGKVYLGSTLLYDSNSQPTTEPLYTEDDGTTLVLGTTYAIPTTIYPSGGGEPTQTVTHLTTPLKISNLTSASSGGNYYYNPVLSDSTPHTSFNTYNLGALTYLAGIYRNMTASDNYANVESSNYYSTVGKYGSGHNYTYTSTNTLQLTNTTGYENAKLIVRPYIKAERQSLETQHLNITFQLIDAVSGNVLSQSIVTNKELSSNYVNIAMGATNEIAIPTNGFKVKLTINRTDDGSLGDTLFKAGSLKFSLKQYLYDTSLYCNISRTIIEDTEHPYDEINLQVTSSDVNSQYLLSISEQGVATITEKNNGGN